MHISLRAALLAGALVFSGAAIRAEPISLSQALAKGTESSPRVTQAKAQADAAEARQGRLAFRQTLNSALRLRILPAAARFRGFGVLKPRWQ
jgi:hypothetical protein